MMICHLGSFDACSASFQIKNGSCMIRGFVAQSFCSIFFFSGSHVSVGDCQYGELVFVSFYFTSLQMHKTKCYVPRMPQVYVPQTPKCFYEMQSK